MTPFVPLLSIDPSSRFIGWALLGAGATYLASGVKIVPLAERNERVVLAAQSVYDLVQSLPVRPAGVLIEVPSFVGGKAKAHIEVYFRSVGAVQTAVYVMGFPIAYVEGSAERDAGRKARHCRRFREITGKRPETDDEADAVCLGIDWLQQQATCSPPSLPDGYPQ